MAYHRPEVFVKPIKRQLYPLNVYVKSLMDMKKRGCSPFHGARLGLRYYSEWLRTQQREVSAFSEGVPWITFEARDFLVENLLKPEWSVFEYGSGGSTVFLSKKVRQVISIEHDVDWFGRVAQALRQGRATNCELSLIPPEIGDAGGGEDPANPADYCSSREEYREYRFLKYAASIDSMPDQSFDLVIIDGRARPSCIQHAYRKVKVGGWLLLDNSERQHYQRAKGILSGWEPNAFFGPGPYGRNFWETTVWRRLE